jgi:hypothetical protein
MISSMQVVSECEMGVMSSFCVAAAGVMISRFLVMAGGKCVVLRRFSMMVYRLFGHRLGGGYILKQNEGGPGSLSSPILFTKGCSCFPEIA